MTEHKIDLKLLAKMRDNYGHSIFSPSASSMYLHCAGSLVPNLLADDDAGVDAAYGTVAHFVTETWLKEKRRPYYLIGENRFVEAGDWGFLIDIDEEMLDYARMCVDRVEWLPGEHFTERKVDISSITPIPNQRGTSDYIIRHPRKLEVWDWKFGIRHVVYAKDNSQLYLYAYGALMEFDSPENRIEEIVIHIVQPRIDHYDVHVITRDELLLWAGWAKARMAEAWQINAPRLAGEKQCQFCRVRANCAAAAKMQADLVAGAWPESRPVTPHEMLKFKTDLNEFDYFSTFAEFAELTTEEMAKLYLFRPAVDTWWKRLQVELMKRQVRGDDISPCKIVEGRSFRAFRNVKTAAAFLLSKGCDPAGVSHTEYCTPPQAEKLLRRAGIKGKALEKIMTELVYRPPGKPTLVRASDKRPALVDITAEAFSSVEDPETETEEI